MLVSDYVSEAEKRLIIVGPDLGIREVAQELDKPGIDLVVVADHARVLGVVTDSDIVSWVAKDHAAEMASANAATLMTDNIFSCKPDQSLASVVRDAASRGLKHFPIIGGDGSALGVVYVSDALIRLEQENKLSSESLLQYIRGAGYR